MPAVGMRGHTAEQRKMASDAVGGRLSDAEHGQATVPEERKGLVGGGGGGGGASPLHSSGAALAREPRRDFLPMSIVWCPIPMLTWMCPIIGHLGIVTSDGVIHDFVGPYTINKSRTQLGFGRATKYVPVEVSEFRSVSDDPQQDWDDAVEAASSRFEGIIHTLCYNNCHSHVADALNRVHYRGFSHWNTLFLIILMCTHGRFVTPGRCMFTYCGSMFLLTVALLVFAVYSLTAE